MVVVGSYSQFVEYFGLYPTFWEWDSTIDFVSPESLALNTLSTDTNTLIGVISDDE